MSEEKWDRGVTNEQQGGKKEERWLLIGVILIVCVVVAGILLAYTPTTLDLPPCVAGDGEMCPSPKWVKIYKRVNEEGAALRAGIPKGYVYNDQTGKFTKQVPPPPPPQPTVVPPAPPPTAPPAKK